MPLGASAMPPAEYLDFCQRQPGDCGAAPQTVLAGVAKAKAERAALLAAATPTALAALASNPPAATSASRASNTAAMTAATPPAATLTPATAVALAPTDALTPAILRPLDMEASTPRMSSQLWARLNRVNDKVNRAFRATTDIATYGRVDYWATPIAYGVRKGDCEDYVLEKQRALIADGLPREALNIGIVVTPQGETHAVLLVATSEGEFVLDNMSPWVKPWDQTGYRWRQRQVDGDPFNWVMIQDPARRPAPAPAAPMVERLVVASLS
ncbi:transglutaminase-like cysteine peptidase [Phenylobacterium sp. LjRoot219]|uniref:transglutaminase-like cysteine peptidase n=1 Tax=Phenylobacterium sp. LjRoot219 TaxID=3342283 RepID=UPI003ECDDA91